MNKPKPAQLIAGPPPTATATKFWNMASVSEDEGEITLYGDVMSQMPIDWWTGEPEPGLFITPEGFMEDLALVREKANVTVKLNSCGGDLYTGIAIHNALKALTGNVNIVVEGIAASAASVIMCAGDTVTVYPGSLVMIHGVSVMLYDWLNISDMKQLMKGMDASERAVAEIYNAKTGIDTESLRSMMTKETWMTGQEAVDKGFADVCERGESNHAVNMSMSADKKLLFVNGVAHNVSGLQNIPGTIPVTKAPAAKAPAKAGVNKNPANNGKEGGKPIMNLDELRKTHPELVAQIEQDARTAATADAAKAAEDERKRLQAIESIEAAIGDPEMIAEAKYGEKACTAQELSFRALQKHAKNGTAFLAGFKADGAASGAADVGATPTATPGSGESTPDADEADIQAVVNAYNKTKGGTK